MTESQTRPLLSAVEARALAVLLEKERTVPDSYPMSLNALLHGCNQRSNRDPVMNLDESQLLQALEGLREQSLVIESSGSRVTRYEHNMGRVLGIPGEAAALLAVLMLRGPQTAAELRAHVERLARFADTSSVEAYLHEMAGRADGSLVVLMPRQSGAREQRWRHCLSVPADAEVEASGSEAAVGGAGASSGADGGPQDQAALAALMQRLAVLEEQVQALSARVQTLEAARMPSDGSTG